MKTCVIEGDVQGIIDKIWAQHDKDDSGSLEFEEMKEYIRDAFKKIVGEGVPEPTDEEMLQSFKAYDMDGCGKVTKDDMTKYLMKAYKHE